MTLSHRQRVADYYARKRSLSFRDVSRAMFRTHDYAVGDTLETANFPTRTTPVTFHASIRQTAAITTGMLFEMSNSLSGGLAVWLEDGFIGVQVGAANAGPFPDALRVLHPISAELDDYHIAVSVKPGPRQLWVWVNGEIVARTQNVLAGFPNNAWAPDGASGSFGVIPASVTPGVPAGSQTAPVGYDIISRLSVFVGQLPRHFTI